MFLKRLRQKRKHLLQEINQLQQTRKQIKNKQAETINKTMNTIQNLKYTDYTYKNNNNELPFGWQKGTVRATIALWITITTCIGFIMGKISVEFFLYISGAVILSYFVSRARTFN